MTKELSKQICEKCGIEPIEGDHKCITEDINCKYGIQCVCPENCTRCGYFEKFAPVYPDFGQPENFVKLWELKIKHPDTQEMLTLCPYLTFNDRESFLNALVVRLKLWDSEYTTDYQKKWIEEIKKAIREAEWTYE